MNEAFIAVAAGGVNLKKAFFHTWESESSETFAVASFWRFSNYRFDVDRFMVSVNLLPA